MGIVMDRFWFFTWRTYGSWLPGEDGFVGYYRPISNKRQTDNLPGTPTAKPQPLLAQYEASVQAGETVLLNTFHAQAILSQLQETASVRGWAPDAIAIIATHVHVVFGVPGDPDPSAMLRDFKSYASRALNNQCGRRESGGWWADQGSKRPLKKPERRVAAIRYVHDQDYPLLVWLSEEAKLLLGEPAA
jgi:hypothetical protein